MEAIRSEEKLVLSESPGGQWILAAMLLFVGALFISASLGVVRTDLYYSAGSRGAITVFGFVSLTAGLWMIHRSPISRTTFDRASGYVFITRRGIYPGPAEDYPLEDITDAVVFYRDDHEGIDNYQVRLTFSSGEEASLSLLWSRELLSCENDVREIRDFLDLKEITSDQESPVG